MLSFPYAHVIETVIFIYTKPQQPLTKHSSAGKDHGKDARKGEVRDLGYFSWALRVKSGLGEVFEEGGAWLLGDGSIRGMFCS